MISRETQGFLGYITWWGLLLVGGYYLLYKPLRMNKKRRNEDRI